MEDKNGKIRVKIQKYPISNIGMDILNKEMDCCDALAPALITDMSYTLFESFPIKEQKVYSKYFSNAY